MAIWGAGPRLGVEIEGPQTVGHIGVNRGFCARLLVNPKVHVALVVLTNGDNGRVVVDAVLEAWHSALKRHRRMWAPPVDSEGAGSSCWCRCGKPGPAAPTAPAGELEERTVPMTKYMLMIPDDYAQWAAATGHERQAMYAQHEKFAARLAEGGHTIEGGSELRDPSTAKTVRVTDGEAIITDGPYSEAVEQMSGFYLIDTDDLDDLLQATALIATSGPIEVRACGSAVEA